MKRILYVEHNTDGTIGGSHRCLLDIVGQLNREKFEPLVCFFQRNSLYSAFEEAGVKILEFAAWRPIKVPGSQKSAAIHGLQSLLNVAKMHVFRSSKWMWFLKRNRVDLVHLNNACGYDHDLMTACVVSGIPFVVHERGIQSEISGSTRFFSRFPQRIITISDAVNSNLIDGGISSDRLFRIDDGICLQRIRVSENIVDIRKEWEISRKSRIIGIVGNIKEWKGQDVLLAALPLLLKKFPDLVCFFVGSFADLEFKRKLEGYVLKHGLSQCVRFTGYAQNPIDYIAAFDVFVHASIEPEPFGIVILEAMACGKAVIATNFGGPAEIVLNGVSGYLVEPGNVIELAARISDLLESDEKRSEMGIAGMKRVSERYTDVINVQKIEEVYDEALFKLYKG
ncbi:MAG: glycosyltransferase family 4 protein [Pseudomonadales bacterium]